MLLAMFVLVMGAVLVPRLAGAADCSAPEAVCAWQERIAGIKTPNMIASGILLSDGFILTNRHVAEDHQTVLIRDPNGRIQSAEPMPHNMPADLVILRTETAPALPEITDMLTPDQPQKLYVVAFDQGRGSARIYQPSGFAHYPDIAAFPQARIHSDVRALPGNSGGAVVDSEGRWIGILASGAGNINEIIPARHIVAVADAIDERHRTDFMDTGKAIRICADTLYAANSIQQNPPQPIQSKIERNCLQSKNKQLLDQAGQLFGRWWQFETSEMFLKKSEMLDPFSPNTLMSLAVTYHLSRDAEKELPILKRYLDIDPQNTQALRLGAQVAGMLKDRAFADRVLALMQAHNPAALPLAQDFIDKAFEGGDK